MIRRRTTPLAYTNALYSALLILVLGSAHPVLAAEQAATLSSTDEFQSGSDFTDRSKLPGAGLYQKHCASCHLGQVYKAPHQSWLEMMPQGALYRTMSEGIMAPQAAKLSNKQRIAIIEYLTSRHFKSPATGPRTDLLRRRGRGICSLERGRNHGLGPGHQSVCARGYRWNGQ